ncbi:LOW QUALITY PROTEIN: Crinkler (CRN) family protein [Phytophthora palmivora]|uniref:Crinkler (CRN) family protein n=1 Tax=Phytophthora palmivora TaxID=4796 RepID=A0A2P4Y1H6_9STRA|nr:LOW QUALITY PROTEIN: Crinkler (CRN) family protein [Phytophthora palmivora]
MIPSWTFDGDEYLGANFRPGSKEVHVLVEIPGGVVPSPTIEPQALREDVNWYGIRGMFGKLKGIDPNDSRILSRMALTNDIIRRVDEMHVLLIKRPPMTGKTSLATLPYFGEQKNDSMKPVSTQGYTIYLVVDEVQTLYKDPTSSSRRETTVFWELVKLVRTNAAPAFRILMFGVYGSSPQYTQSITTDNLSGDIVLGIEHLNFRREVVEEYVNKWFVGIQCLQRNTKTFCNCLQWLTGGYVGLCEVAMLKTVYFSRGVTGLLHPPVIGFEQGSLYQDNDHALFKALISTRAVKVLKTLKMEDLDGLERNEA